MSKAHDDGPWGLALVDIPLHSSRISDRAVASGSPSTTPIASPSHDGGTTPNGSTLPEDEKTPSRQQGFRCGAVQSRFSRVSAVVALVVYVSLRVVAHLGQSSVAESTRQNPFYVATEHAVAESTDASAEPESDDTFQETFGTPANVPARIPRVADGSESSHVVNSTLLPLAENVTTGQPSAGHPTPREDAAEPSHRAERRAVGPTVLPSGESLSLSPPRGGVPFQSEASTQFPKALTAASHPQVSEPWHREGPCEDGLEKKSPLKRIVATDEMLLDLQESGDDLDLKEIHPCDEVPPPRPTDEGTQLTSAGEANGCESRIMNASLQFGPPLRRLPGVPGSAPDAPVVKGVTNGSWERQLPKVELRPLPSDEIGAPGEDWSWIWE